MTRYAMLIDQERCIGCHACSIACRSEHNIVSGPSWMRVETEGGRMDVPAGVYPDLTLRYRPIACMQCEAAPCIEECPTGAISRRDDGVVTIAAAHCNGCAACVVVCPYDALQVNDETGIAEKCNYCVERVGAGLKPFCVVCCEGQALFFGDLDDPAGDLARMLANRDAFFIQEEAGTKPTTRYCAPLPRREILAVG